MSSIARMVHLAAGVASEDDDQTWTAPKPTPLVHPDAPPMLFPLAQIHPEHWGWLMLSDP